MIPAFSHLDPSPALLHASGHGISAVDLVVPLLAAIYMFTCFMARKEAEVLSTQAVTAVVTAKQHEQVVHAPHRATIWSQLPYAASKAASLPAFASGTGSVRWQRGQVLVTLPALNYLHDRCKYADCTKPVIKQQKAMGGVALC